MALGGWEICAPSHVDKGFLFFNYRGDIYVEFGAFGAIFKVVATQKRGFVEWLRSGKFLVSQTKAFRR